MRPSSTLRRPAVLVVAAVFWSTCAYVALAEWDADPFNVELSTEQHYLCGADDLPEGALQGHVPATDQRSGRAEQGYNCGLALVGHTTLDAGGRPPGNNANMAWAGDCAYVAGPGGGIAPQMYTAPPPENGVAVVDVRNSSRPKHVATLRTPGAAAVSETLHAVTTPEGRSILVVGQYGNDVLPGLKPMDVYDVSARDCSRFEHMRNPDDPTGEKGLATFYWPENSHNLTISENGKYVFATQPLQAADISGLWDDDPTTGVEYLGNVQNAADGPLVATGPMADLDDPIFDNRPAELEGKTTHPGTMAHEAWPSPDGTTLYVGGVTAQFEVLSILDLRDWLARDATGAPRGPVHVVSQQSGRGHSVRTATIDGEAYLLHSEEAVFGTAYGCLPETLNPFAGPAQPWLTNIDDPAAPVAVSQFGLEINRPENCGDQLDSRANQSVHYHDVDDPDDTTFVMASMWNGGIRVFDVRDPARPTEVAYFNPGDVRAGEGVTLDRAWGHVRYVPKTGEIWFATSSGGFWVVRIEGQVREYLGLDEKNVAHGRRPLRVPVDDRGRPGTVGLSLPAPLAGSRAAVDATPWYCTLPPATSL